MIDVHDEVAAATYYERTGPTTFRPTRHAGGAWRDDEQHMGPVSGLLVHAVEQRLALDGSDLQIGRLTFEILGMIPASEVEVAVEVVRPGRTIQLVEAVMSAGGRAVVRLRAWLLAAYDTSAVAGGQGPAMPPPGELVPWDGPALWSGGYIASVQIRRSRDAQAGRSQAWVSTALPLVAGEPVSTLARYVGLVDTANGIATRQPPTAWMYPNLDLSIHLFRQPAHPQVGFDTTVVFGGRGAGLTSSVLHDLDGPVGRAEQILTVRPIV